jgi:hypothetical protein
MVPDEGVECVDCDAGVERRGEVRLVGKCCKYEV